MAYQEITEETTFLRGRLAMSEYIQNNLLTGRHQYFHSTYEPFIYDNKFNRIVKYVTRLLLKISKNSRSTDKLQSLLFILDEVSDEVCTANDCTTIRLNPLYENFEHILSMCKMFLEMSFSENSSNNDQVNFCLLFPMEVIFEDFVFGFIEKHLPERKPQRQTEQFLALNAEGYSVFKLKNDILLQLPKLIIDTKYKIREKTDNKKGVAESDMYQMLTYAIKQEINTVLLIYPLALQNKITSDTFTINSAFLSTPIAIGAVDINIFVNKYTEEQLKAELLHIF